MAGQRVVADERDLGALPALPVGTPVLIERTQRVHTAVGLPPAEIVARLGWSATNIWLPEHVGQDILAGHPGCTDLPGVLRLIVAEPTPVLANPREPAHSVLFLRDAGSFRWFSLLASQSSHYVEAAVEWRAGVGGQCARLFHCSPRRRLPQGIQRWP